MAERSASSANSSSPRASAAPVRRGATVRSVESLQATSAETGSLPVESPRHPRAHRAEQLLVLTVAIVFGVLGFPLHFFWIVALVFMALLWGYLAAELGSSRRGGAVSNAVTAIAGEARDLGREVSTHLTEHDDAAAPPDDGATHVTSVTRATTVQGAVPEAEPTVTKKELYEEAREAGIEGRSAMTKEELQRALEE